MKRWAIVALLIILLPSAGGASNSANYRIEEDFAGGSGGPESSSGSYKLQDNIGAPVVNNSASGQYQQHAGPITTNDPTLSFIVNTPGVDFGRLSTSATKTGVATFSVLNYTSYGYIVQSIGHPLLNSGHPLAGINPAAPPQAGTEQFGINLKDNTSPDIGAEAVQVPDSSFSLGQAASGYDTPDLFKYAPGDVIAFAPASSGRTDYTVSYVANMSITTPGGVYSGNHTLVVTGTY